MNNVSSFIMFNKFLSESICEAPRNVVNPCNMFSDSTYSTTYTISFCYGILERRVCLSCKLPSLQSVTPHHDNDGMHLNYMQLYMYQLQTIIITVCKSRSLHILNNAFLFTMLNKFLSESIRDGFTTFLGAGNIFSDSTCSRTVVNQLHFRM